MILLQGVTLTQIETLTRLLDQVVRLRLFGQRVPGWVR